MLLHSVKVCTDRPVIDDSQFVDLSGHAHNFEHTLDWDE